MGQVDEQKIRNKGKRAENRDNARVERQRARALRRSVDMAQIDGSTLIECLAVIARGEGALRIGLSRDGGAFAFGIYGDGDPYTEYVGSDEDVNEYLRDLTRHFDALLP